MAESPGGPLARPGTRLAGTLAILCVAATSGCVVRRGTDFGSAIGRGENIPVIRVYNVEGTHYPTAREVMLLLPLMGRIDTYRDSLQQRFHEELQNYFHARIVNVPAEGRMREYVKQANIVPEDGFFDFEEVQRLGSLLDVDYVVCLWVQDLRPYPPQNVSLYLTLLDVSSGRLLLELDASFNASEQKVVVALQNYLQRRRARRFDQDNLAIMLQSPSEYHLFVAAETCRAMALELATVLTP